MFLKLFKKTAEEYVFEHKNSPTLREIDSLVNTTEKILESVVQKNQQKTVLENRRQIKG